MLLCLFLTACSQSQSATPSTVRPAQVTLRPTMAATVPLASPSPSPEILPTDPTAAPSAVTPTSAPGLSEPEFVTTLPGQAASFAIADDGTLYVVTGEEHGIYLYRSRDGGLDFETPVRVNPDIPAYSSRIERPSVAVLADGRVAVTWLQLVRPGVTKVWYTLSEQGASSFRRPVRVNDPGAAHRLLVRMSLSPSGRPVVSYLQVAGLHLALATPDELSFEGRSIVIDDQVCDCCQPQLLAESDGLFVAYRNLELDADGRQIRDIYLLALSPDNGRPLREPVRISDAPWYLDACPTAGPALAAGPDGTLYAAFIDGRNDDGSRTRTDLFLAASTDGGRSFGPNTRINPTEGAYNGLSALAVGPDGRLYVGWQAVEDGRSVINYTTSAGGASAFYPPLTIAAGDDISADGLSRGRPDNPDLKVGQEGRIYLLWLDNLGVHLAVWPPS